MKVRFELPAYLNTPSDAKIGLIIQATPQGEDYLLILSNQDHVIISRQFLEKLSTGISLGPGMSAVYKRYETGELSFLRIEGSVVVDEEKRRALKRVEGLQNVQKAYDLLGVVKTNRCAIARNILLSVILGAEVYRLEEVESSLIDVFGKVQASSDGFSLQEAIREVRAAIKVLVPPVAQ